jgi:acetyltransferase-like isoleucine patch superfamily enzyme
VNVRALARFVRRVAALDEQQQQALLDVAAWVGKEHTAALGAKGVSPDAWISPLSSIRHAERVEIGSKVAVGPFASVWGGFESAWARVGDEAQLGPGSLVVAGNHRIDGAGPVRRLGFDEADVVIGAGAWIGANAVVIGCTVGEGAVVGAGAVVTSDVPAGAVAMGVPARVVRMRRAS